MWKYYRKGRLVQECNDVPETMEDAVIELEANSVDTSDCLVKPLTSEEEKEYFKAIKSLKHIKAPEGFETRLYDRIKRETGEDIRPSRLNSIKSWWSNVTTGERVYLSFWLITFYLLAGLTTKPKVLGIVCEIFLWPFFI